MLYSFAFIDYNHILALARLFDLGLFECGWEPSDSDICGRKHFSQMTPQPVCCCPKEEGIQYYYDVFHVKIIPITNAKCDNSIIIASELQSDRDIHTEGGCDDDCLGVHNIQRKLDCTIECPSTCPDRIRPCTEFKSTKKSISCLKINDSANTSCPEVCSKISNSVLTHDDTHPCDYDPWKKSRNYDENVLPTYAQCQMPRFRHASVRDMAYEMLPTNLRKDLHARAAKYLHGHAQRCAYCGGGMIIVFFPQTICNKFNN